MTNFSFQQIALVYSTACVLVSGMQLQAKSESISMFSSELNTQSVRFVQPTLEREPKDRGAPGDRKGAGSRGGCPVVANKPPLTGIVPLVERTSNQKQQGKISLLSSKFVLGLTVSEYPTFWFYVPYSGKDINSVKFVLLDENNNYVTKEPISVTVSGTPGVISVTLPKTEKPLEVGKFYHWFLSVDCQTQDQSENTVVEGLVQRIATNSNLMRRIARATPQERVALYAQEGIWQDALTLLGELRRTQPQNTALVSDWKNLLTSIELQSVASESIVPCCKL